MNDVVEVAEQAFLVRGSNVNWYLLRDGTDLTLIDAGYPGDLDRVEESVRSLGRRPEDIQAILLTHAHVDHMGAINAFHHRYQTPVLMDAAEVPLARRNYLEQAGVRDVLTNLWRPGVLPWTLRVIRSGGTKNVVLAHARAFPADGALDLPGSPVPLPTHGHTSGHCAFHLPAVGAVLSGDELVTGHPTSRIRGPQLLPDMFQHARTPAADPLAPFESLDADLLLPGHGEPHRAPIAEVVRAARAHH
jgi:glyoxylase-like metal-dependent hydrolase (beta-lactamase superfamily II)